MTKPKDRWNSPVCCRCGVPLIGGIYVNGNPHCSKCIGEQSGTITISSDDYNHGDALVEIARLRAEIKRLKRELHEHSNKPA